MATNSRKLCKILSLSVGFGKRARDGAVMAAIFGALEQALTTAVFPMTHLVFFGPCASCFQGIAMLLALDPSLKSLFINRQVENARRAEQFPKRLHYLRCGVEDNLVHCFRLAPGGVSIE